MNIFSEIQQKKWSATVGILILILVFGWIILRGGKDNGSYEIFVAKKGELRQEVSITGRVIPQDTVDLSFEKGGEIAQINAEVGDMVTAGDILVVLDDSELSAELAEALAKEDSARAVLEKLRAVLLSEEAKLAELKRGVRPEEIRVEEVKVRNAEIALEDAKRNIVDILKDTYTKSDDAVRNKVDQFFNNPRSANPQVSFPINDTQLEIDLEWERFLVEGTLVAWKNSLDVLNIQSEHSVFIANAKQNINTIKSILDKSSLAVNALTPDANFSQTTIDGWKSDVSTARSTINTATTNLTAALEKLRGEESDLALAKEELTLKQSGSTQEVIDAGAARVAEAKAGLLSQQADIRQAEARVNTVRAQIAKTVIRSPIDGVIAKNDATLGEIVSANSFIILVISEGLFEIETQIPEADIAKINLNDAARVTLDAYGDSVLFSAQVALIDPAETFIEGVATYKTTLYFNEEDERVRRVLRSLVQKYEKSFLVLARH